MRKAKNFKELPIELRGGDVYDVFFYFDNENEGLDYISTTYSLDKKEMYNELHENDELREKLGIDKTLLRHCSFSIQNGHLEIVLVLSELMSGEYVLYETY